ncbi:tripartite tricarboxylate transporter TctB family protein [Micromonospora sp. NPDC050397]|uniref:tripartite tricarboxylate transporter TctB family protein n=1 Tax=Micromonospora sp. NPDC050397 TaxID=3364279 RepID=UPI00384F68B1
MALPTTDAQGRADRPVALPRAPWGARILGVVLLLAGGFLCWTAYRSADGDFSAEGPWLAPLVVTAGWVVLAVWYLVGQLVRPGTPLAGSVSEEDPEAGDDPDSGNDPDSGKNPAGDQDPDRDRDPDGDESDGEEPDGQADGESEPTGPVQWLTPALLGVALLGYVLALEPLGFVLASAVFFVATARILGSHHSVRDVLVAVPLTVGIYLGFTQLLEISLPAGVMPL